MKNLCLLFLLFCAVACTKESTEAMSRENVYELTFEVEDESPKEAYYIQVSHGGQPFTTVDTLRYTPANGGVYHYTLKADKNTQVRVAAGGEEKLEYSPIVLSQ